MRYRLTREAQRDVRDITQHIRTIQRSPQNARLVGRRIKAAFASIARTPTLGHQRPELQDDGVLVLFVSGVLIIYDRHLKPLTILRVIHAARDLSGIDPRR